MASRDVTSIAGVEAGQSAIANREDSESVVLYLEKPIVAVKRFGHQLDDLNWELSGCEHIPGSDYPLSGSHLLYDCISVKTVVGADLENRNLMLAKQSVQCVLGCTCKYLASSATVMIRLGTAAWRGLLHTRVLYHAAGRFR
jgi:hypothetical protein